MKLLFQMLLPILGLAVFCLWATGTLVMSCGYIFFTTTKLPNHSAYQCTARVLLTAPKEVK